jgi:hypothetical protein
LIPLSEKEPKQNIEKLKLRVQKLKQNEKANKTSFMPTDKTKMHSKPVKTQVVSQVIN